MIIGTIKKYTSTIINFMGWKVALSLGLMVMLGLMEGVSLLMLVPLLQLVGLDVQQGSLGHIAGFVASFFLAIGIRPTLIGVLCVYIFIVVIHSLLRKWENAVSFTLEYEFIVQLRQRFYRAIANTHWLFFLRYRSSDFTHALTIEMERIGAATYMIISLTATVIISAGYILFALKLSFLMTLLVFLCGIGLMVLLKGKRKIARETGEGLSEAMSGLYHSISEHLGGMKIAKSFGAEERHVEIFKRLAERVSRMYTTTVQNQAEVNYWFQIGSVITLSLILYVSVEILSIPTAGVLLLLFLFARVMPKLSGIHQNFQSFINLMPSFSRVMELMKRCEEAAEPPAQGSETFELKDEVRFEKVSFSYEGKTPVIRHLDLTIHAGQTTAIVGPSGAGKSTIADLVMGLILPQGGHIVIDEKELTPERVRAWRPRIGYVPQEPFLFHDTLKANLLWVKPGTCEEEIKQALRLSAAEEFVSALPRGLDTVLGDRGALVSGGERQRLALARALLSKPSLLILDEATSSLDSENEKRILNAIEELHGKMTILVISHRLSTIRGADVIYVIEEGRLIESGTWDSLVGKEDGRFRALCLAQGIEISVNRQ
jgi:ATP-binding cassette, subfamily C, bacterial